MRTLLLGMGNPILSDDAVGVRLARDFRARFQRLESAADLVVIEECSLGGINLLDIIAGYERLIVLDSIQTREGVPGDWRYFTAEALRETMNLSNIHDTNFATALLLAHNVSGCLSALGAVRDEQNPAVQRLRGAIRRWKEGLSMWQRIRWFWGDTPGGPIELGVPPGEI